MSAAKRFSLVTGILFVLAAALLLFSTIGGARAALTFYSQSYTSELGMLSAGIGIAENGTAVSGSKLLANLLGEDKSVIPGKKYDESIVISTSGIDEYVRVVLYKYWVDENGKKDTSLSPDLIELGITGAWVEDTTLRTDERSVWYCTAPVNGGVTFADSITINDEVLRYVSQDTVDGVITTTYLYDGMDFCLEIEANGVQTHHAADAILSAWGRVVQVSDGGALSLG